MGKRRKADDSIDRKVFVWSPCEETARTIESLRRNCGTSANAVITALVEYALAHATLKPYITHKIDFEGADRNK